MRNQRKSLPQKLTCFLLVNHQCPKRKVLRRYPEKRAHPENLLRLEAKFDVLIQAERTGNVHLLHLLLEAKHRQRIDLGEVSLEKDLQVSLESVMLERKDHQKEVEAMIPPSPSLLVEAKIGNLHLTLKVEKREEENLCLSDP